MLGTSRNTEPENLSILNIFLIIVYVSELTYQKNFKFCNGNEQESKIISSVPCKSLRMRIRLSGPGPAQGLVEPEYRSEAAPQLSWGCGRRKHRGWDSE